MTPPAHTPGQARRRLAAPTVAMLPRIADSLSFLYLDIVRIHQDGRIVGDVIAPRVVFVSDKPIGDKAQSKPAAVAA